MPSPIIRLSKIKNVVVILLFILIAAQTFSNPITPKRVVITGKVINTTPTTPETFRINFLNPFIKYSQSAKLNSLKEFSVTEDMLFTQNMTIAYNKTFINLYVQPGDSVHLTIDAALLDKPNFEWLTITGDHALISTQLNKCHLYLSKIPVVEYDYKQPAAAILLSVKKDYEKHLLILKEYAVKNALRPEVIQWAERNIKYTLSYWVLDYMDADSSVSDINTRIKLYADPFFDMYNPANFQTMMFTSHLANYAYKSTRTNTEIALALKQNNIKEATSKGISLLLKEPAGLCRDYMLFNYLYFCINKSPAIIDSIGNIKSYFSQPISYDYFKAAAALAANISFPVTPITGVTYMKNANGVTESVPAGDVYSYLSKKYPGKVIYMDMYATWCAPCLEEMKNAPALHKAFKGKGVVFVNLCLQSDMNNWKKLIKKANIAGENYFLDDNATKLFMGTYRINGFPAYMLVNKAGKIVTTIAPRPSEKIALNNVITKLLN